MAITLEEATEATDIALSQCIDDVMNDGSLDKKEKERLIDTLLETRQKSIESLMSISPEKELLMRGYKRDAYSLVKYANPNDNNS